MARGPNKINIVLYLSPVNQLIGGSINRSKRRNVLLTVDDQHIL